MKLDSLVVKPVGELQVDQTNFPELAGSNELAGMLDDLVAAIAVGHSNNTAALCGDTLKILGLGHREAQRLFTHNVQPAFQCSLGDLVVGIVGRCDRYCLDPIRTLCLLCESARQSA